jgi:hypothetical protein
MGLRIVVSMICFEVLSQRPSSSSMLQSMVIILFEKFYYFNFFQYSHLANKKRHLSIF